MEELQSAKHRQILTRNMASLYTFLPDYVLVLTDITLGRDRGNRGYGNEFCLLR